MRRSTRFWFTGAGVLLLGALRAQTHCEGRVGQINVGGTPAVSEAESSGSAPRLGDGRVDLTGPWLGGGSNGDLERDGGLKPGELPLLPWARDLRDRRKPEDEPFTAC